MSRTIGTVSRGVRAPIIRNGDKVKLESFFKKTEITDEQAEKDYREFANIDESFEITEDNNNKITDEDKKPVNKKSIIIISAVLGLCNSAYAASIKMNKKEK